MDALVAWVLNMRLPARSLQLRDAATEHVRAVLWGPVGTRNPPEDLRGYPSDEHFESWFDLEMMLMLREPWSTESAGEIRAVCEGLLRTPVDDRERDALVGLRAVAIEESRCPPRETLAQSIIAAAEGLPGGKFRKGHRMDRLGVVVAGHRLWFPVARPRDLADVTSICKADQHGRVHVSSCCGVVTSVSWDGQRWPA